MKKTLSLAAAVMLAAGAAVNAQALTAGYTGTTIVSATAANTGNMFDLVALNAAGVTITGFDIHSSALAGTPITVEVLYVAGGFQGLETFEPAWTVVGSANVLARGALTSTPVPIGGVHIPAGETYGFYINVVEAGASVRYNNAATTPTTPIANADLQLNVQYSAVKNGRFGGTLTPRGFNGTIYYTPGTTPNTGACCFPTGACFDISQLMCSVNGYTFNAGQTCATANCPQPGSCCLGDGTCAVMMQTACTAAGGVFGGGGTTCATANCEQAGACCLPDGHCVKLIASFCASNGGSFSGAGTTCAATNCPMPAISNGAIINEVGLGHNGANLSRATANVTTAGSTVTLAAPGPNFRIADDFTITDPAGMNVSSVIAYGYITSGAYPVPPQSPWTAASMNIWDGIPGDPGSNIVATSTNMAATGWTGIYRLFQTGLANNRERPIMYVQMAFSNLHLNPGTYWIDYQLTGMFAGNAGGFASYVMDGTNTPVGNGRQLQAAPAGWVQTAVEPSLQAVDFPFAILADGGPVCYPNCDGSTVQPILNIDDFTCFINAFATGQALPPAQQVTHYANCDGSTVAPVLNIDDFTCFINEFAQGCP